ncbi:hypothetical protein TNCV_3478321 [Trichonephila clavipes]|nr:hypothetical protein TNCV_3478321 [Trichonephila clavipes]
MKRSSIPYRDCRCGLEVDEPVPDEKNPPDWLFVRNKEAWVTGSMLVVSSLRFQGNVTGSELKEVKNTTLCGDSKKELRLKEVTKKEKKLKDNLAKYT